MKDITICEKCNSENIRVLDKRTRGGRIWRRHECVDCGNRITTYEIHADDVELAEKNEKLEEQLLDKTNEIIMILRGEKV